MADDEYVEGYRDGRDPDAPEPSVNRSHRYRHSFAIGRAEIANRPIPYQEAIAAAEEAAIKDDAA
jgi:hypothetical protein